MQEVSGSIPLGSTSSTIRLLAYERRSPAEAGLCLSDNLLRSRRFGRAGVGASVGAFASGAGAGVVTAGG